MDWIIGIISFLAGTGVGALLFKIFVSDEVRIKELEARLQQVAEEHEQYKAKVHGHFDASARLLNDMTETYRNVYQHMAKGAQALCPDYISSQLSLGTDARTLLETSSEVENAESATGDINIPEPPRDYAARTDPDQKGNLQEDYGIDKPEKN